MQVNSDNYKQFTLFALALMGISTLAAYGLFTLFSEQFSKLHTLVQIVVSIPSVPVIYAGLFFLFDRFLWKYGFFEYIGVVVADDLNGKWTGVIKSSWDDFKTEIAAEMVIKQTATTIKIFGKFNESRSVSIHEYFGRSEMHGQTALYYFYKNDPNYNAPATMAMHEGSTILIYDRETKVLSGYYYSGRDRHNHGTISVQKSALGLAA